MCLATLVVGTLVVWEELRPPEILREIAVSKRYYFNRKYI